MNVDVISDVDTLVRRSKHCGWCTKEPHHAQSYLAKAPVIQFTKDGKRRASYQMHSYEVNGYKAWELKSKGNISVHPAEFIAEYPEHENIIRKCIPESAFRSLNLDARELIRKALETMDSEQSQHIRTDAEIMEIAKQVAAECITNLDEGEVNVY